MGRTGRIFALEHADIVPDVLVLSKAIGGGYPMSVIIYHKRLDSWLPGMHAGTFRGNQIAMVAGCTTMQVIKRENLAMKAQKHGELLVSGLKSIAQNHPFLGDIRGRGLMIGVEVVIDADRKYHAPANGTLAKLIKNSSFAKGLILETGGRHGSVLRFLPPLTVSSAEIGDILDRFESAVNHADNNQAYNSLSTIA
jgi:diaminobutyrate-2-oxoglutarate transaminase